MYIIYSCILLRIRQHCYSAKEIYYFIQHTQEISDLAESMLLPVTGSAMLRARPCNLKALFQLSGVLCTEQADILQEFFSSFATRRAV